MKNYLVKETSSGEIVLVNDDWQIGTNPIHKEIWKQNYLDREVVEGENFSTDEIHIDCGFFQVIANPIISTK